MIAIGETMLMRYLEGDVATPCRATARGTAGSRKASCGISTDPSRDACHPGRWQQIGAPPGRLPLAACGSAPLTAYPHWGAAALGANLSERGISQRRNRQSSPQLRSCYSEVMGFSSRSMSRRAS